MLILIVTCVERLFFLETGNWKTTRYETICDHCYITNRCEIEEEENKLYNEYLEGLREGIYGYNSGSDDSDDSDNEN